ncbi:hypothetical protein F8388_007586 [Cannabis sativa]|uniref:Uncharacterized protein n=1 Tax=Cannabis sativa TaxID=3483 RepID=A0A7J6EV59_CANSA|nr:hypothetical protein F8388_007586 [Cannabis sativa]
METHFDYGNWLIRFNLLNRSNHRRVKSADSTIQLGPFLRWNSNRTMSDPNNRSSTSTPFQATPVGFCGTKSMTLREFI